MKNLMAKDVILVHSVMCLLTQSTPSARIAVGSSTTARFVGDLYRLRRKSAASASNREVFFNLYWKKATELC